MPDFPLTSPTAAAPLAVVTGASGFIGTNLVDALAARGIRVRCLLRSAPATVLGGTIERMVVDYDDPASLDRAMEGAALVFHLGGVTKALSIEQFRAGNVRPTRAVVEALRQSGSGARLVLVSSQAAGGAAASPDRPRREDDAAAPTEPYGQSKLEAERLVAAEYGGPWTIVRPAAVYGPHDRDFLAVFRQARAGFGVYAGSRARWLSVVHVRDLIDGMIRAALTPTAAGRTYYLTHDAPATWQEVYRAAALAASVELRTELDVPQPVVEVLGWVGDAMARLTGRVGILNSNKVALGRAEYWLCSGERARRELSFSPAIGLADGMRATYAWYRERGWL